MTNDALKPITIPYTKDQVITDPEDINGLSIRSVLIDRFGQSYRVMFPRKLGDSQYLLCTTLTGTTMHMSILYLQTRDPALAPVMPLTLVWTPDNVTVEIPTPIVTTFHHFFVEDIHQYLGRTVPPCEICGQHRFATIHTKVS